MNTKIVIKKYFVLLLSVIALVTSYSLPAEERFVSGVDYELLIKADSRNTAQISELEVISNIEIFYWYGCASCYQVEAAILDYQKQNPELSVRRTPLVVQPEWRQQAYIQPLMLQLSGLENLPTPIQLYQQCLTDCSRLESFESIVNWFAEKMPDQALPSIDEELIWQTEKNYQKRADLFSIRQVPTIIVNETYQVDANLAQSAKRLVEIIDFLITQ